MSISSSIFGFDCADGATNEPFDGSQGGVRGFHRIDHVLMPLKRLLGPVHSSLLVGIFGR
jgi:hypothetical protein